MPTMHLIMYVHSQKSEKSNTLKVFEGKGYPKVFEGKATQKSLRARLPKSLWGQGYPKVFEGKGYPSLWGQGYPCQNQIWLPMIQSTMYMLFILQVNTD